MLLTEENVRNVLGPSAQHKTLFVYFFANVPECAQANQAVRAAVSDDNAYITLAEADIQSQIGQALAMQMGLRAFPAIIVLKNGQPVDALQGDDVVTKLGELLQKFMPKESELLLKKALEAEKSGDLGQALRQITAAYQQDEKDSAIKLTYIRLCIAAKQLEQAEKLLGSCGRAEQDTQEYKDLLSALTLARQAQDSPEIKELQRKHEAEPHNDEITSQLAAALSAAGKRQEALELLLDILRADSGNAKIRQTFIDVLNTMAGDPLQSQYRKKLYTLLY